VEEADADANDKIVRRRHSEEGIPYGDAALAVALMYGDMGFAMMPAGKSESVATWGRE